MVSLDDKYEKILGENMMQFKTANKRKFHPTVKKNQTFQKLQKTCAPKLISKIILFYRHFFPQNRYLAYFINQFLARLSFMEIEVGDFQCEWFSGAISLHS